MDWKRDLDELIAATMAFANDIKAKPTSDSAPAVRTAERALADRSKPTPILAVDTLPTAPTSEREEILRRVNGFRAHQEEMARQREQYYLHMKATMTSSSVDPNPCLITSRKNPPT